MLIVCYGGSWLRVVFICILYYLNSNILYIYIKIFRVIEYFVRSKIINGFVVYNIINFKINV